MDDFKKNKQCQVVIIQNISEKNMLLLIEPWGEEVQVPPEKTIAIHGTGGAGDIKFSLEYSPDYLVVIGCPDGNIAIEMDGEFLNTGSRVIPIPKVFFK